MTELDVELGPLTVELIDEFGATVTLTKPGAADYDTDTGKNTPGAGGGPNLTKAIIETGNVKGLVEGAVEKWHVAAASFDDEPGTDWTATKGAVTFAIMQIDPVYSGELVCLYSLHVGHK